MFGVFFRFFSGPCVFWSIVENYGEFKSIRMKKLVVVQEIKSQSRDLEEASIHTSSLV